MKKSSRLVIIIAAAIFVGAVVARLLTSGPSVEQRRQNVPRVKVELPRKQTIASNISFTGDVQAIRQAGIFSRVGGNLEQVFVNIGDRVNAGRVLARIDTTELAQQLLQAAATFQNAQSNYQRAVDLHAQNLVSQQDLDNAQAAIKIAQSGYEQSRLRLGYATITAPFEGIITRRHLDPGALVNANSAILFDLMDIDPVKVTIDVLEKDVARIQPGMKADVKVDAYPDRIFTGTIVRLSEAVDLSTRTMPVEVDVPNADRALKPGMFATVVISLGERPDVITVPTASIMKDERGAYVWHLRNSIASRQEIKSGDEQGNRIEILSGLAMTDTIVVAGMQLVHDNGKVVVQN